MQAELEKLISEINTLSLSDEQLIQHHKYQHKLEELDAFITKHENDGIRACMLNATQAFMRFREKIIIKPLEDFDFLKTNITYIGWKNEGLKRNKSELLDKLSKLDELHKKNLQVRVYALLSIAAVEFQHGDCGSSIDTLDNVKNLLNSFNHDQADFYQITVHANMHNSYGLAYRATNNYNKALTHFKKSLSILELYTIDAQLDGPKLTLMNNIAAIFTRQKKWKEAIHHANIYYPFIEKQLNSAQLHSYVKFNLSTLLTTMSLSYTFLNKFIESREKLEIARKLLVKIEAGYSFANTNLLYNESIYYRKSGNYKLAIDSAQRSFQYIFTDFNSMNIEDNPKVQKTDFDKMQKWIIESFSAKAGALLAYYVHENKDFQLLKNCIKTIDQMAIYFDAMRADYRGELTKFSLGYYSKHMYDMGQLACWYLYKATSKVEYAEKAFAYANSSKALVLVEEMHKKWLNKNEINFGVEQIQAALNVNETIIEYSAGEKGIFIYRLSKNSPVQFDYIDIEESQQLSEQVNQWLKNHFNIYQPNQYEQYQLEAFEICNQLILPYIKNIGRGKTLLIAPDGFLNALPFEALVCENNNIQSYSEMSYLIDKYTFAYSFSSYFLYVNRQKRYDQTESFLLYLSPNFLSDKTILEFQHMQKEQQALLEKVSLTEMNSNAQNVFQYDDEKLDLSLLEEDQTVLISKADLFNLINQTKKQAPAPLIHNAVLTEKIQEKFQNQWNIELFENEQAQIKIFQTQSPKADYILISSHAETDKGIVFYNKQGNDFTYLGYQMVIQQNLKAKLVVLNMCDSGRGKTVFGEGYLSMGRAFFAAGSLNVIQTLYKVSDKHSANLIAAFFTYVLQPKVNFYEALRKAKLILRKEQNSHPKFWAGHVIYGKNGEMIQSKKRQT